MKTIEYLMIFNAIVSQIGVSFIFTFIESLFLEISENFFIKLISSNIFDENEKYNNKSLVKRIRDITIYDPSQTNITIWTSILGAYFINKFGDLKILIISYLISIISLILTIFLPYNETEDKKYREISDSPFDFKFLIPSILILITLSISIGNYNLHSLQYIVYYYNKYKGFLIPFYVGIGCLIKYGFIRGICLFFGESHDEYQKKENYKLFLIFCIIFISICFLISFLLTYAIENLINKLKSDNKEKLKDLIIKTYKKDNFKNSLKVLFFGKKSSELYCILILNLFSKIEKIEWKYYNEKNLSDEDLKGIKTKNFINCLFIILSFIVGYIHDKYDFNGFKRFLVLGNCIDIISSIFFSIYVRIKGKNDFNALNVSINYTNLFFIGNYYAIMLPELMRKYGPKFILELSGFIGLSNILSRIIEVIFTVYPYEEQKILFFGIMFLQILCSSLGIILIYKKKVTNEQHQEFILNEIDKKDNDDRCLSLSVLGIKNNKNEEL